jgi:hypothetical protein
MIGAGGASFGSAIFADGGRAKWLGKDNADPGTRRAWDRARGIHKSGRHRARTYRFRLGAGGAGSGNSRRAQGSLHRGKAKLQLRNGDVAPEVEILDQARNAGFLITLFFVGIDDPRTNIERVALRVAQGGHDVPADRIVPRWRRSMGLLYDAIRASDDAYIFDNSAPGPVESGPQLVFFWRYMEELSMATHQQFPPIPPWVNRYVLAPLFRRGKWPRE